MVTDSRYVQRLLELMLRTQRRIRREVLQACVNQSTELLSAVVADDEGDTIFAVDRISERVLLEGLEREAKQLGGIVLIAEGLPGSVRCLPEGYSVQEAAWRVIVDPIDGTRGIMYQKRSAWVLCAIARNRGASTALCDVEACAQVEIPTLKQHLCDEWWAIRGQGVRAERYDRFSRSRQSLRLQPTRASDLRYGYAMVTRFFPGARDVLAAIDDAVMFAALQDCPDGKGWCFEDQYTSTGGQLYELASGHDRFNADLRPLLTPILKQRGLPVALCCHPYDICTELAARELGVIITDPLGDPLDAPLDVVSDVAWVGYGNDALRARIEPLLQRVLREHGLIG